MASGVCHLRNAALPLLWIREEAVESVTQCLSSITESKALVLSKELSGPLGFLIEVSLLRKLGIEAMFELSSESLPGAITNIVYFIRPTLEAVKVVAKQVI